MFNLVCYIENIVRITLMNIFCLLEQTLTNIPNKQYSFVALSRTVDG